jgi:hypothetical protein
MPNYGEELPKIDLLECPYALVRLGRYQKTRMSEQKPLQTKTRGFEVTGYMGLGSHSSGFLFSGFLSFSLVSFRSRYPF